MSMLKSHCSQSGASNSFQRTIPTPQAEIKGYFSKQLRLTPKTPETELKANQNIMKRVAYTKSVAKNTRLKASVACVPKFEVTLNLGGRNTPQKPADVLIVKKQSTAVVKSQQDR